MKRSLSRTIAAVSVFVILEAVSVLSVSANGIVQRYAVISAFTEISSFFSDRWSGLVNWLSLKDLNSELAFENALLVKELSSLRDQLNKIKTESDSIPFESDYNVINAMVIANSTGKQHNSIILNKGGEDGVAEGMGVVTARGIIGFVRSVTPHYARVSSMLDVDNKFSIILSKSGTFGSLSWNGKNAGRVMVYDVPLHTEVSEGDTLISSGYSAIYPYGVPIGTICSISVNDGINYELEVALFENFHSIRYVDIIGFKGQGELDSLMKEESGL